MRTSLYHADSVVLDNDLCACDMCYLERHPHSEHIQRIEQNCRREGDCLVWMGSLNSKQNTKARPIGKISFNDKNYAVQRVMWWMHHKVRLERNQVVMTTCGNSLCCAIQHFRIDDTFFSKFGALRSRDSVRNLTMEQVRDLRLVGKQHISYRQLAAQHGVSASSLWRIMHNIHYQEPSTNPQDGATHAGL